MRLRTLRGMATVPARRLSSSDLLGPIDRVAVDRAEQAPSKAPDACRDRRG
ncbi:hypothetical protein GCM10010149_63360 [Nonomuraea roseoviolacea subsp. roseoviolacea]|uniref:hypothetical protein n=1 Tax=Nonomuraea roseoviolacea TaxID=103837 RepID=UPI0031DD3517